MSILVNGSPTEEINIKRGLKQGDPLAHFLFLLVAEGLDGLMKRAVELNRFKGFRIGNQGVVVSHLQYADDTLCIGEPTLENLWTLKAILRSFEMVSGLKVNFWKSSLLGVNVSNDFLRLAAAFLNSRVGSVPFKYLGHPVGANIRRMATWDPLISSLRKRLGSWSNKFVSLGGRIVLLNSVLNAIPIFYLSFLKLPVQVWKTIKRIQRDFLWGSRGGSKRVNWVKWEVICKLKRLGGLSVRDLRVVNINLLTKWHWRFLNGGNSLWQEVIRGKYRDEVMGKVDWGVDNIPWYSSLWWKDLCSTGVNLDTNWFGRSVKRKLGNGMNSSFWVDVWVGSSSLKDRFPRLFSISNQKEAMVAELWNGVSEVRWNFIWRRRLFVWEETLVEELVQSLQGITLTDFDDKWCWCPDSNGEFSVNSTFDLVSELLGNRGSVHPDLLVAFKAVWKCPTPSKVQGFARLMLHDRIPTKVNLFRRKILTLPTDQVCVQCSNNDENLVHLLIYCPFARQVWEKIFSWTRLNFCLPHSCVSILHLFAATQGNKKTRQGMIMIWCATVWVLWNQKNPIIFNNGASDLLGAVDEIKLVSWKWWIGKSKSQPCLLYEWLMSRAFVCCGDAVPLFCS
jgi:hypothetical protein